jgi:hypothetical protein
MSTNSPFEPDATSEQVPSVADLIAACVSETDQREIERAEMVMEGMRGIVDDLAMNLRAECAARGIDWFDLLAAAARRCLWPGRLN